MARRTLTDQEIKERIKPWNHLSDYIERLEREADHLASIALEVLGDEITHADKVGAVWAKFRADLERLYGCKASDWGMKNWAVHDAIIELDGEMMAENVAAMSIFTSDHANPLADDYHDFHYDTICKACGLERTRRLASTGHLP